MATLNIEMTCNAGAFTRWLAWRRFLCRFGWPVPTAGEINRRVERIRLYVGGRNVGTMGPVFELPKHSREWFHG